MSNSYFQFRQFRVEQAHCAMKVTTDACIQGAWTPILPGVARVLDIGTGTGLLSLMLAQRDPDIIVDAVEIDASAAQQARENIAASPWADRINVIEGDVCAHAFEHKYDLVISNPPFFNNSLLSDKAAKNIARHTLGLSYNTLLKAIDTCLHDDGYMSILLPYTEYQQWSTLLQEWSEFDKLSISHRPGADVKRVVGLHCRNALPLTEEHTLVIQDGAGKYSNAFTELLSPFYLNL